MTHPQQARPVRWRLALVTWAMLTVVVSLVDSLVMPRLGSLPGFAHVIVLTGIVVVMMTWLVMPLATRVLTRFLTSPPAAPEPVCSVR